MFQPSSRRSKRLATQATELAFAVPQVVLHRFARMASAGANPSASDRLEFHQMGSEKLEACYESWAAMGMQVWRTNAEIGFAIARFWMNPWVGGPLLDRSSRQFHIATLKLLSEGLGPVHRRAMANAKRLGKVEAR